MADSVTSVFTGMGFYVFNSTLSIVFWILLKFVPPGDNDVSVQKLRDTAGDSLKTSASDLFSSCVGAEVALCDITSST